MLLRGFVLSGISLCLLFLLGKVDSNPTGETRCYNSNEQFTKCGSSCPKTCDTYLQTTPTIFCPTLCVPGCFCKEGYVRNRWWNCVLVEKCPCQGVDEVFTCGSACQTTCATLNQDCPIKTYKCVDLCRCRDGFAKDNSGTCIPIELCPEYNKL